MNSQSRTRNNSGTELGWTRVSSFKPHLAGLGLTGIVSACLMLLFREQNGALALIAAGTAVAMGVMALNCKVVHRRGTEYRVVTLLYAEVVSFEDVCMTVSNPGWLWTSLRIHLCRPARCGWRISFVPANEACKSAGIGISNEEPCN